MAFLLTIWSLALMLVVATLVAAARGVQGRRTFADRGIPIGWWDMYVVTYQDIIHAAVDVWHVILPHFHNGTTRVLSRMIAWRDKTYTKLFGYHAVPQGGVVSYFLKRITEHKDELRQKIAERQKLHGAELPAEETRPKHDFSVFAPPRRQHENHPS